MRTKRFTYVAAALLMLLTRLLLAVVLWQPSAAVQVLWAFVSVNLALFVAVLALARFYTRRDAVYLFIGIGYVGVGVLGAYYLALLWWALTDGTAAPQFGVWQTAAVFLAVFLAGSWLIWVRSEEWQPAKRSVWVGGTAVLLVNVVYFAVISGWAGNRGYVGGHLATAVAATFFLIALLGYLQKKQWRTDAFEHSLILALIIMYGSQVLFMAFANNFFDALAVAALIAQAVGYLIVLLGLLISIISIFRQVEMMAAAQAEANETLQREISERERFEMAENEQRQLAEALREVGIALSSVLDFDRLLDILLDQMARVLPYDTANVMLVHGDEIEIGVTRGYGQDIRPGAPHHFPVGRMPSLQQLLHTGEPVIVPDTAVSDLWVNPQESPHVRSWAGAPISIKGDVIAILALNNSHPGFYQPEAAARLSAFAGQAGVAFENARLYEQVRQRAAELATLNTISQAISSTLDLPETLTVITEGTVRLLRVEAASVVLLDQVVGDLMFAAASGLAAAFVKGQRLALGQGVIGWVVQNGEPVLVPDTEHDTRYFSDFDEKSGFVARSILCVPLQAKGQTIGALEAINKESGLFDQEDLKLLTRLAAPAATAIENARLFAQAQQEIAERTRVEMALEAERSLLARRVAERTADLSAANAELAHAARLKDEFLASMSHELRTPLNAVLGISEALQEEVYGPLNENQIVSLRSIEESGRHLLALINDILDLSKIEAGKLELELTPVPVEMICQASLRIVKQNAHKKRLTIHSSFDGAVTTLQADERRMKQILVNLLANAVKFTPEGGKIGLEVVGDTAVGVVHITVWDTGIGIAEADMARLFQPFVQLDSRLAREYGGTGLGLSLVQRMMDLHGGTVAVESEVGKGSRFTISFPWQQGEHQLLPLQEAQQLEGGLGRFFRLALVVDDSPAALGQLKRYFNELNVDVVALQAGEGVVEKAVLVRPDVIVLDILLPDISGWEVLSRLKANPQTRRIPVIIASVIDERENALAVGAADCLLKPVTRQQLHRALQRLMIQVSRGKTRPFPPLDSVDKPVPSAAPVARPRILLAEDNAANIHAFSNYLAAKGYDMIVVHNGRDAVDRAKQEKPDIILMDIQMPQMNGLDAIREIRADASLKQVPIIAVTALAMPGDQEKCLAAGANDYLSKPVSLKGLLERIEIQLSGV
ncbi:MAG TPA: response regulator [Chloroflexota bacterium]|nr:response regulator [Chloroflexota bacterium]